MIANLRWTDALRDAVHRGAPAVLVAVGAASGSTPREAGVAMVVTAAAQAGTIGGGHLEYEATRVAREALAGSGVPRSWAVRFPLAARLGQCCGGVATLVFATIPPRAAGWLDAVGAALRAALPCVVASRLGKDGAADRRIVVTGDAAHGTLGDAELDATAIAEARARLGDAAQPSGIVERGGAVLFLHVVHPARFAVCVFGHGHVGRALVHVLGALPADVRWIDAREHDFPAEVPANVTIVATDDPVAEVAAAPRRAHVVVMTHSHATDFEIVEAALARDDLRYVGLIGSKPKRAQLERRLVHRGLPAAAMMARLTCPIGATFASKEPGVIAVAVAAELLAVHERAASEVQGRRRYSAA